MENLKKNKNKFISFELAKKIVICLVFILFFDFFLFPAPILASQIEDNIIINQSDMANIDIINQTATQLEVIIPIFNNTLPDNNNFEVKHSTIRLITAYNSEVGQTDDSPCITANGFDVCQHGTEDTVAANFLPFGAKVKIPELFGNRVFIVRDRMNTRFSDRLDVWMVEKHDAVNFGVKIAKIEILK